MAALPGRVDLTSIPLAAAPLGPVYPELLSRRRDIRTWRWERKFHPEYDPSSQLTIGLPYKQ